LVAIIAGLALLFNQQIPSSARDPPGQGVGLPLNFLNLILPFSVDKKLLDDGLERDHDKDDPD